MREVKVWYDREADYLTVLFDRKEGYFRETDNDAVMEEGNKETLRISAAPKKAKHSRQVIDRCRKKKRKYERAKKRE